MGLGAIEAQSAGSRLEAASDVTAQEGATSP